MYCTDKYNNKECLLIFILTLKVVHYYLNYLVHLRRIILPYHTKENNQN